MQHTPGLEVCQAALSSLSSCQQCIYTQIRCAEQHYRWSTRKRQQHQYRQTKWTATVHNDYQYCFHHTAVVSSNSQKTTANKRMFDDDSRRGNHPDCFHKSLTCVGFIMFIGFSACRSPASTIFQKSTLWPGLTTSTLISILAFKSDTSRLTLQDHRYGASALRSMPVYSSSFTSTHCT